MSQAVLSNVVTLPRASNPRPVDAALATSCHGTSPFAQAAQSQSFCPLSHLDYAIQHTHEALEAHGMALITGQEGRGKTILMRRVQALSPHHSLWLEGRHGTGVSNLIKALCCQEALPLPSLHEPIEQQWHHAVHALVKRHETTLLLVDQAHLLPLSTLSALVETASGEPFRGKLQVALAGTPELIERCQSYLLGGNDHLHLPHLTLPSWTEDDVEQYLFWSLGQTNDAHYAAAITQEWCAHVHQRSEGEPRAVTQVADSEWDAQKTAWETITQRHRRPTSGGAPWWNRCQELLNACGRSLRYTGLPAMLLSALMVVYVAVGPEGMQRAAVHAGESAWQSYVNLSDRMVETMAQGLYQTTHPTTSSSTVASVLQPRVVVASLQGRPVYLAALGVFASRQDAQAVVQHAHSQTI